MPVQLYTDVETLKLFINVFRVTYRHFLHFTKPETMIVNTLALGVNKCVMGNV